MTEDQKMRAAMNKGWRVAPSALSPEQKRRRLGLNLPAAEVERMRGAHRLSSQDALAPAQVDWRAYATPVRDQGNCGSCVAFGVTAAIEAQAARAGKAGMDLSEAYLFFCGCGNCCDRGWQPADALNWCMGYGLIDEECFPYADTNVPCAPCGDDALVVVEGWHEAYSDRKTVVAEEGPMPVAFMVYDDFFDYAGGVYRHTWGQYLGGHCVALFGYDAEGWLCKNSWGPEWGEDGWFRIGFGECGMDNLYPFWAIDAVSFPEEPPPPPPEPNGCADLVSRLLKGMWR